jgi:hypothetical protein
MLSASGLLIELTEPTSAGIVARIEDVGWSRHCTSAVDSSFNGNTVQKVAEQRELPNVCQ